MMNVFDPLVNGHEARSHGGGDRGPLPPRPFSGRDGAALVVTAHQDGHADGKSYLPEARSEEHERQDQ